MVYDYIIIGAGSAGCVLANRLSRDPNKQVLLLEAGGKDLNPWIHIPIGYFKTMHNPSLDWCHKTEPDPGLNNRSLRWPRGKVLGGSSSLNGLLYIRGQAADYDRWAALGNSGWSYADVLPFFKKSENNERGANRYHGVDGELAVSNIRIRRRICDLFIRACEQIGIPANDDFNGAEQEGVGYFQLNIDQRGLRSSASSAFLKPARKRSNLSIQTNTLVHKILFDGKRACGVRYSVNGRMVSVQCQGEVISAAGSLGSPKLLMLSGIGAKSDLSKQDIESISDLIGVGKNLQDHLQIRSVYKVNAPMTLNDELKSPFRKIFMGLQYLFFRTGPLTMAASQVAIFTKSKQHMHRPDIQYHLQPLSADQPADGTHSFSAFTASVCQLRPTSRGYVSLRSRDPEDPIAIHPNYLSSKEDQQAVIEALKLTRRIIETDALKPIIAEEHEPGVEHQSEEQLLEFARNRGTTIYHPVGTCKMGQSDDDWAVVDERLKVYGVSNLRVVDCSIMPEIISGNTNAAAIMIAEKAASMIIEDHSDDHQPNILV